MGLLDALRLPPGDIEDIAEQPIQTESQIPEVATPITPEESLSPEGLPMTPPTMETSVHDPVYGHVLKEEMKSRTPITRAIFSDDPPIRRGLELFQDILKFSQPLSPIKGITKMYRMLRNLIKSQEIARQRAFNPPSYVRETDVDNPWVPEPLTITDINAPRLPDPPIPYDPTEPLTPEVTAPYGPGPPDVGEGGEPIGVGPVGRGGVIGGEYSAGQTDPSVEAAMPGSTGGEIGTGCIIVTACHGPDSEEVEIARKYRDLFMNTKSLRGYYIFSEQAVDQMQRDPNYKEFIEKELVAPLIAFGRFELKEGPDPGPEVCGIARTFLDMCFFLGHYSLPYKRRNGEII